MRLPVDSYQLLRRWQYLTNAQHLLMEEATSADKQLRLGRHRVVLGRHASCGGSVAEAHFTFGTSNTHRTGRGSVRRRSKKKFEVKPSAYFFKKCEGKHKCSAL